MNLFLYPNNQLEEGGRPSQLLEQQNQIVKTCPNCRREVNKDKGVCFCGYHFRISARERISLICDANSFHELFTGLKSKDPLSFPLYKEKLKSVEQISGEEEGVVCGKAKIGRQNCCIFAMEPNFLMGSMGTVVGEKITLLFEYATKNHLPIIGVTLSGGARMHEGLLSLMQMAKTSMAVKYHSDAGLLYIALLADPTTGGVTASFAMEADIIIAEPGATVGFAGKRVIEQTTRRTLPEKFQKAEFVLEHGFIDLIVERSNLRKVLTSLLRMHRGE